MSEQKYMLIRGPRIIQQIAEDSTYSDLERGTVQGFPNTTKFKVLTGTELDAFAVWADVADDTAILAITDISRSFTRL